MAWPKLTSAQIAASNADGGPSVIATVKAGKDPGGMAINSVTDKIYVADRDGKTLTVIDGMTNTTTTVKLPMDPGGMVVNEVTNKIYVKSWRGRNVWVLDGATNAVTVVPTKLISGAMAVNSVTNKIYVANSVGDGVTVIDGVTNATAQVATGWANAMVVNSATDKVYVACESAVGAHNGTISVIDGATNSTSTIKMETGWRPTSMAVNPVTNKIYLTEHIEVAPGERRKPGRVMVIDGATNAVTTIPAGIEPRGIIVNPETDKIFVTNFDSNTVTVIDGATNATGVVRVGLNPQWITSNTRTNKIYVTYFFLSDATHEFPFDSRGTPAPMDNSVTVIDGALFKAATTQFPGLPVSVPIVIAVNPATNRIYITHFPSEDVTVMDGASMNAGGIVMIDAKAASSH
nr:YncE family protein [Candidatus Acidoferrales bacterium]